MEISVKMRGNAIDQALAMSARARYNLAVQEFAMPARAPRNLVAQALATPARTRRNRAVHAVLSRFPSIYIRRVEISRRHRRNPVVLAVAMPEKDDLATEFMSFVNNSGYSWPRENRKPTPLMPPSTVVKTQMDALMRNDWPDEDSGIKTAFEFSLRPTPGEASDDKPRARAWDASRRPLTCDEFVKSFKYSNYTTMVNCLEWKEVSRMVFQGDSRAAQTVQVRCRAAFGEATAEFTFSLRRVLKGPYKDCWMVDGVRPRWPPF